MAKAKDIVAKVLDLVRRGKIPEASVHRMFNGMIINGTYAYCEGMLKDPETGAITSLSPDRIESLAWPPRSDADIRQSGPSKKSVMRKSGENN